MELTLATAHARGKGKLPELLGLEFTDLEPGRATCRMTVREQLLAPNGYLHAASVIAAADTACGFGTLATLPEGAENFTTVEIKSNFLATAVDGTVQAHATLVHGGRTTQVWDAEVVHLESSRRLALFRCTQIILYPRKPGAPT